MLGQDPVYLFNIRSLRPAFESLQIHAVEWLAAAHAMAERTARQLLPNTSLNVTQEDFNIDDFVTTMKKMILRFGCNAEKIHKRGHSVSDFNHFNFSDMEIYPVLQAPSGVDIKKRGDFFQGVARGTFREFYANEKTAPRELIHVSCTGYVSPSAAQEIVAEKSWHEVCQVTHAYHMGCYAAIPAIRMAKGFCQRESLQTKLSPGEKRVASSSHVDVVHTELCTLHLDPSRHEPEQLVVQSLFADGFVKYSIGCQPTVSPSFEILAAREEIVPDSLQAMSWNISSSHFAMTLSRNVPSLIAGSLGGFLARMCESAGYRFEEIRNSALFAIHPGGPKIIDEIQALINASDLQVQYSKQVLFNFGNMSSATLPHVWELIASRQEVASGTLVISMAFGPGLTMSGCLMRKC